MTRTILQVYCQVGNELPYMRAEKTVLKKNVEDMFTEAVKEPEAHSKTADEIRSRAK